MSLNERAVVMLRREFPSMRAPAGGRPPAFLDGPGGTQVHESVIGALSGYLSSGNSYTHGAFSLSRATDDVVRAARETLRAFLNAREAEEIVFGPNMTTLTFQMSRALGRMVRPGDEIVVTRLDHDANVAPWYALEERGAVIREVDFHAADCTLDWDSLRAAITERTRLVAVGYASNAVGTINDVRTIAGLAHAAGAWVYVDAVHYAPHGPIDVQDIDCDFLVCSAHKFFGPHLGVLFGKRELLEQLPAYKIRPASDRVPDRFETGTLPFDALAGATAAVRYLASVGARFGERPRVAATVPGDLRSDLEAGMQAIRTYESELCATLLAGLARIDGLTLYGIADPARWRERVPTVSFTLDRAPSRDVAARLGREDIFVWDGSFYAEGVSQQLDLAARGGLVRVGLAHYSLGEDIDRLLSALVTI